MRLEYRGFILITKARELQAESPSHVVWLTISIMINKYFEKFQKFHENNAGSNLSENT